MFTDVIVRVSQLLSKTKVVSVFLAQMQVFLGTSIVSQFLQKYARVLLRLFAYLREI